MMLAIIAGAVDLDGAGLALCDWFDAHLKL
jgi:hypothetical protein